MPYARRTTRRAPARRTSYSRARAPARRVNTRRSTARKGVRSTRSNGQTVRLVIEHSMPAEMQRPAMLVSQADRKEPNKKKTF